MWFKNNINVSTRNCATGLIQIQDRVVSRIKLGKLTRFNKYKLVLKLLGQVALGRYLGIAIANSELCLLNGCYNEDVADISLTKIQDWASRVYIGAKSVIKFDERWVFIFVRAPDQTWRQLIAKDDIVFYDRNLGEQQPAIAEETRSARTFLKRYGLAKDTVVRVVQIGNELPNADIALATLNAVLQSYQTTPWYILPHRLLGNLFSGIFPITMQIVVCGILIVGGIIISPKAFACYKLHATIEILRKNSAKNISDIELKLISLYRSINDYNPDMVQILKVMTNALPTGEILSVLWENNKLTIESVEPIDIKKLSGVLIGYKIKNVVQNAKNL